MNYILYNCQLPMLDSDAGPDANAIELRDGRIAWVGRAGVTGAPVDAMGRSEIPVIDLQGATVLPGFIDNHVHLAVTGDVALHPQLNGLSAEHIREVVKQQHAELAPGETIQAYGWDYPAWPDPHRRLLDEISSKRPMVLFQFSGHAACVNSAMLKRLGITAATADPPDGTIERDADGEPSGILREGASRPLHQERMRQVNGNRRVVEQLLETGQNVLVRHGITGVGDNTWYAGSAFALARMRRTGRLLCRVTSWSLGSAPRQQLLMRLLPYDAEMLRRGPVKYFLDGAFSTHTALLIDPYCGEPENHGTAVLQGQALQQVLLRLTKAGRQGAFHAIGDAAVRNFLDAFENLSGRSRAGGRCMHRLEHCQLVAARDMQRLARLGVLVAAQPHALSTPEKDEKLIGAERASRAYPYRSLLNSGVSLSFGSDSPAEPSVAPLEGIRLACLRPGEERITVREAVECYTKGSALAEGTEAWKGSIGLGKAADLVVLTHNPLEYDITGDEEPLRRAKVLATVLGGRAVYTTPSAVACGLGTAANPGAALS